MKREVLEGINNSMNSFVIQFECERRYIGVAALKNLRVRLMAWHLRCVCVM